jgi:hypothetical protein
MDPEIRKWGRFAPGKAESPYTLCPGRKMWKMSFFIHEFIMFAKKWATLPNCHQTRHKLVRPEVEMYLRILQDQREV